MHLPQSVQFPLMIYCLFICLMFFKFSFADEFILEGIEIKAKKDAMIERIDRAEIRELNKKDIGEALEDIGGISKVRKGSIANDIVLRGFQKDNINVLVDGMRVYGACPNRMDPAASHIDLSEVDQIEVLKGPFDVLNPGSMGGLINIRTRSARPGFDNGFFVNYESFNSTDNSAFLSYGSKKFSLLLGGSYKFSRPYKDGSGLRFTEIYPENSPNRYKNFSKNATAYSIKTGWIKLAINPSLNHSLEISYSRQMADDVLYPFLLMDAKYDNSDRINAIYSINNIGKRLKTIRFQFY